MRGADQGLGFVAIISLLCVIFLFLIQSGCQEEGSAETNPAFRGTSGFNTKITAGPRRCKLSLPSKIFPNPRQDKGIKVNPDKGG